MPTKSQRDEVATAIIDTQLLDVLGQMESLLREAREVQRQLLRVRGVPQPTSPTQQRQATAVVRKATNTMVEESVELTRLLRSLKRDSDRLLNRAG